MADPRRRNLVGYGRTRPHAAWPGQAQVASVSSGNGARG